MTQVITEDLVIAAGEVHTYGQGDFFLAHALVIGWFEGTIGEVYFEPSVTNYGEMHLGATQSGAPTLLYFAGSLSWDYGVMRNYGLIRAVAPDDLMVRAMFTSDSSPDVHNAGTIVAEAGTDAIGYEGWDPSALITNAASGTIRAEADERSLAIYLPNGGTVVNHGQLLVHASGGGHDMVQDWAIAVSLGGNAIVRSELTNSGSIIATDADPTTQRSVGVLFYSLAPVSIVNSGTIRGDYAIKGDSGVFSIALYDFTIENSGLLDGKVVLTFGRDNLKNTNRIVGDVDLGDNDDVYDGALGTIVGTVQGGEGNDRLKGGAGVEQFFGGAGDDSLDGGGGADRLTGGDGNDSYHIDNAGDQAFEAEGGGGDTLYSSISYALAAGQHIETLAAADRFGTAAINLTGNALANTVAGNAGANGLDGGAGADLLYGFGGNDSYHVDLLDQVFEEAGGGSDTIYAGVSYVLAAGVSVEVLATAGASLTSAINLTGNALAQTLVGNAGANVLNGKGGADALHGLGGNDIYHVDVAAVQVFEAAGGGSDSVYASVGYVLGAGVSVEVLAAAGASLTTAINLSGNALVQAIAGNAGANVLNGRGGNDVLYGLGGHDTYQIDVAAVQVFETAGGGSDSIYTSTSYVLAGSAEVERLSTNSHGATAAIALTGNSYAQSLLGNAGRNWLDGAKGADTLSGFAGIDTFAFTTALGAGDVDRIADFQAGVDRIAIDNAVFTGLAAGALAAAAFRAAAAAQDGDDRILYNSANGALSFDPDGNGALAAIHFATLQGAPALAASDFIVI